MGEASVIMVAILVILSHYLLQTCYPYCVKSLTTGSAENLKTPSKIGLRPKEQKWEDWRRQKVV